MKEEITKNILKQNQKSKLKSFAILALSLVTGSAIADLRYYEPGFNGDLGLTGYHYHYRELDRKNRFLMQDSGPLYGIYYSLGYTPECQVFRFSLEGSYSFGDNIRYRSRDTGSNNSEKYAISEMRLLSYFMLPMSNGNMLEPYVGIAGRYVRNDGNNSLSSTGHYGYLRESHYSYVPFGVKLVTPLASDMQLISHVEYDWFLGGRQRSHINGVVHNLQKRGMGARAGFDLYIPSQFECFDYLVGTFVRYWNIKDSTVNRSTGGRFVGYEPRNKTWEFGFRAGLVF